MVCVKGNKAPEKEIWKLFLKRVQTLFWEFLPSSLLCMLQAVHFCSFDKLTQFGLPHLRWTMKKGENRKDQFL